MFYITNIHPVAKGRKTVVTFSLKFSSEGLEIQIDRCSLYRNDADDLLIGGPFHVGGAVIHFSDSLVALLLQQLPEAVAASPEPIALCSEAA